MSDRGAAAKASDPRLDSLAPKVDKEEHGVYVTILKRAIDEQTDVRNIALTGTYGTGKSSILRTLAKAYPKRVIEVSLSTLGEQPAPVGADEEGNPAATTKTNRIQKEIVKQLLYQQMPADAPESRFRRISRFPRWREFGLALFVGLVLFVLMVAAGLDRPVIALTGVDPVERPGWSRTPLVYLALAAILIGAVYLVRLLLHDKLRIEQVTAGPASITLPPRSSSYFDEYLDEIVYLFETNSRDIVILEDLDRFDDPLIFETLRSLNNLLNTAKQLKGRRVRFIYALRDSIFEKLGRDENNAITDEAKAELVRANRTKFFDLVVPVVPFITHKNARDHMHRLLTGRGHSISKELVDLAARHVADMRLIYNIVNEYEVFKHQLIDVATPVPQLDEERLLAMVLFKNVHMADFEAIRLGESSLDKLYDVWRALVSANLQRLRVESTKLHERIERDEAAEERAGELAARLQARVDAIVRASSPQGFTVSDQLHVSGEVVSPAELRTAKFWQNLLQGNGSIVLHVRDGYGYQRQLLFSAPVLSDLLGTSLDLDEWAARSATADKDSLERIERDVHFLQHHTWGDLVDRPQFKYRTTEGENALTFRQWLDRLLPSQLAVDLVAQKYITSYFSLHVSSFYGELIRPDAMTYLMRNVDRGTPDADYPLDAEDITAILRDRGTGVLRDRSMYNVSILNHLLQEDADRAKVVVKRLADWGPKERAFVDHYLGAGAAKAALVEQLTPLLPGIFTYLIGDTTLGRDERSQLVDLALTHRADGTEYEHSDQVRVFFEASYSEFPSLRDERRGDAARRAVQFIAGTGAVIPSVVGLSEAACAALIKACAYAITAQNLEVLAGTDNIALDRLAKADHNIYDHALDNLDTYFQSNHESQGTRWTIESSAMFIEVLQDVARLKKADFGRLITGASPDCRIDNLGDAPECAWPALVGTGRIPPTFANVSAYVERAGGIDEWLAALLSSAREVVDANGDELDARRDLATTIVNAREQLQNPALRAQIAGSLQPGALQAQSIAPEPGELIALLIERELLNDDEETFDSRLMVDWGTLEHAITRSSNYAELVGPRTLQATYIAELMQSSKVADDIKKVVLEAIDEFADGVPKAGYQAMAAYALRSGMGLRADQIDSLCRGGAHQTTVAGLLAAAGEEVSLDDLRRILRNMGGDYATIADKGNRQAQLADTQAHRAILRRLQDGKIVSTIKADDRKSTLRVHMKR